MDNEILKRVKGIVFDVDGVLSPSTIPLGADGIPVRMVNIKDGYAIQHAVKHGLRIAILSGARSEAVEARFRGLGISDVIMGASLKLPIFEQWLAKEGLDASQVIMVGDDIPDVPVLRAAAIAVVPADACDEAKQVAHVITDCNGGHGVARFVIEAVMKAQGTWMDDVHAFGW